MLLLAILVIGLAAGWVADLVVHGRMRPENWSTVLVVGLAGSLVGGLLASLLAGDGLRLRPSGLIGSAVGAILVMALFELYGRRSTRT